MKSMTMALRSVLALACVLTAGLAAVPAPAGPAAAGDVYVIGISGMT